MNDKRKPQAGPDEIAPGAKIDYEELRKLIALLEEKNLSDFELEVEGLKIKISRAVGAPPAPSPAYQIPPSAPAEPAEAPAAGTLAPDEGKGQHLITSPMVGTFYRAPDPTAPPFTDIGETVKKGQTLCIIEAMKLMNEIEADIDGTVVEIYVDNARPVEFGQKLFAVRPLG